MIQGSLSQPYKACYPAGISLPRSFHKAGCRGLPARRETPSGLQALSDGMKNQLFYIRFSCGLAPQLLFPIASTGGAVRLATLNKLRGNECNQLLPNDFCLLRGISKQSLISL